MAGNQLQSDQLTTVVNNVLRPYDRNAEVTVTVDRDSSSIEIAITSDTFDTIVCYIKNSTFADDLLAALQSGLAVTFPPSSRIVQVELTLCNSCQNDKDCEILLKAASQNDDADNNASNLAAIIAATLGGLLLLALLIIAVLLRRRKKQQAKKPEEDLAAAAAAFNSTMLIRNPLFVSGDDAGDHSFYEEVGAAAGGSSSGYSHLGVRGDATYAHLQHGNQPVEGRNGPVVNPGYEELEPHHGQPLVNPHYEEAALCVGIPVVGAGGAGAAEYFDPAPPSADPEPQQASDYLVVAEE